MHSRDLLNKTVESLKTEKVTEYFHVLLSFFFSFFLSKAALRNGIFLQRGQSIFVFLKANLPLRNFASMFCCMHKIQIFFIFKYQRRHAASCLHIRFFFGFRTNLFGIIL